MDFLAILMRWTHIASMAFVVGGALYARFVLSAAAEGMGATERSQLGDRVANSMRPYMTLAILLLIGAGTYNLLNKQSIPAGYHMWFGIKMLLAMHIVAVGILTGKRGVDFSKRQRWLAGIGASGLAAILLSAILRSLA